MKRLASLASLSLLCLLPLTACESTNTRGPGATELTITTPPSLIVTRGGLPQQQQFAVNRIGFSNPVKLTISDLPPGVTANPMELTVEAGAGTVSFMAASDAPIVANHKAKVTGSAGKGEVETVHRFNISVK
jgi:hypothetical protein